MRDPVWPHTPGASRCRSSIGREPDVDAGGCFLDGRLVTLGSRCVPDDGLDSGIVDLEWSDDAVSVRRCRDRHSAVETGDSSEMAPLQGGSERNADADPAVITEHQGEPVHLTENDSSTSGEHSPSRRACVACPRRCRWPALTVDTVFDCCRPRGSQGCNTSFMEPSATACEGRKGTSNHPIRCVSGVSPPRVSTLIMPF